MRRVKGKRMSARLAFGVILAFAACVKTSWADLVRKSPDGRNEIRAVTRDGVTRLQVFRDGQALIEPSEIGLLCAKDVCATLELEARNEGVAYRWRTDAKGRFRVLDETIDLRAVSPEQRVLIQAGDRDWFGDPLQNSWQNIARQTRVGELSSETNRLYFAPVVFINEKSAMAVTESDLRDYPGWSVRRSSSDPNLLTAVMARWPTATVNEDLGRRRTEGVSRYLRVTERADYLVETEGPRTFPWRVFMLADSPKDLIGNRLVRDLATPSRVLDSPGWVRPGKVAWDWWNDWNLTDVGFKSGCDTRTYEHYIDFAASNGIAYVIMDEGWSERLDIWRFAPNVDVPHLVRYADARGVGIILWAAWAQVFGQEERVADHFGRLGVRGFKIDFIDRDDAEAVRFVERFAAVCARRHLVVDYHGMYKPTGLEVTYPNILNYEGVHGLEMMKFNADEDMMRNDINILFTRMLAGPVDYTPGAMRNFARGTYKASLREPGSFGTRTRQMALMALYDAPLQMLCDSPSQYRVNGECLSFMVETPGTWDEVRPLAGEPDGFVAVAKRKGDVWYVAGLTDWTARTVKLDLSFLPRRSELEGFYDTPDAATRPMAYSHRTEPRPADGEFLVRMGPGGGFVLKTKRSALGETVRCALSERPGSFDGGQLDTFAFELTTAKVAEADLAAERAWTELSAPANFARHRAELRTRALTAVGGLPEKTPLNVREFGRVSFDGYAVVKLLFESRPRHYVTAHLFLPDDPSFTSPYPGVVLSCGHAVEGKGYTNYQHAATLLARAGFAALIYDPFDQGEREQLPGKGLTSVAGHSNAGLRAHLLGWSAAQFRLWDGLRAHDVLLARPEVDPDRTAVAGMSGGGTLSSCLNAFDGRFSAAAPMGFLTSMRGLVSRCGPQDAEQIVFGWLSGGINHLSLLMLNDHSAVLPGFTYGDAFPYAGSIETFSRAKTLFEREGRGDRLDNVSVPGPHKWYYSEKLAMIGWFRRHLRGETSAWPLDVAAVRRKDVGFRYPEWQTGLAGKSEGLVLGGKGVMSLPGARSVYDLMNDELTRLEVLRPKEPDREAVRMTCGLVESNAEALDETTIETDGCTVKKACLVQPDGFRAFVTAFLPKTVRGTPVMIASDTVAPHTLTDAICECLEAGRPVAVAEARAFGSIEACLPRTTYWARMGFDQEIAAYHVWLGRNLAVGRTEDYLAAGRWFRSQTGTAAELRAEGGAVVAAAHAYYFGRDRFDAFVATKAPLSWTELVRHPTTPLPRLSDLVFGALKAYDWIDLVK